MDVYPVTPQPCEDTITPLTDSSHRTLGDMHPRRPSLPHSIDKNRGSLAKIHSMQIEAPITQVTLGFILKVSRSGKGMLLKKRYFFARTFLTHHRVYLYSSTHFLSKPEIIYFYYSRLTIEKFSGIKT